MTERGALGRGQPGCPGGIHHEIGDTGRMAAQPRRLDVGEVGDGSQRCNEPVRSDHRHRYRLGIKDRLAQIVAELAQPTLPSLGHDVDHGRVVAVTAPTGEHLDRRRPPLLAGPQLHVPSDRHHPHRHRHLVTGQPSRLTVTVPALIGVRQRLTHRDIQPDPGRQAGPDLTMLRQAARRRPWIGKRPHDPPDTATHRQLLSQMAHEIGRCLTRSGHQHRRHHRVEPKIIPAGQYSRLGGIRRAPQEPQQRHIEHTRPRCRVQTQRLRRGERQPTRPQPMLHRLTGAEIRRQRQRHRQLRHAHRPDLMSHRTTLPAHVGPGDRPNRANRAHAELARTAAMSRRRWPRGTTLMSEQLRSRGRPRCRITPDPHDPRSAHPRRGRRVNTGRRP